MESPERRAMLHGWLLNFGILVALYVAASIGALWGFRNLGPGAPRVLLEVLPVLFGVALIWQSVRAYRRSDEFIRARVLRAVAITAVWTALWTLAYAWLEPLGLPHINIGWVHNLGWPVFVFQMFCLLRNA